MSKKEQTKKKINNWEKQGKVLAWTFGIKELTNVEINIYNTIARFNIGYGHKETDLLPYSTIAEHARYSIKTVQRAMKVLLETDYIIKVATNQLSYNSKLPYKYLLNYSKLNTANEKFPNLGPMPLSRGVKNNTVPATPTPTVTEEDCKNYMVEYEENGRPVIIPITDEAREDWEKHSGLAQYPSVEQLENHKRT